MLMSDYQKWLNTKGANIAADGEGGAATREATKEVFVNLDAEAVTDQQVSELATSLGCSFEQISAVANVESSGAGFDSNGRPKILFERHKFDDFTAGAYSVCSYSNPSSGGYSEDSWEKLTQALCVDIDAAFKSVSWGRFQVMGFWFADIGFTSPLEMAYSTVRGEYDHYILFAGYIRLANLEGALRQVSTNSDDCRAFAKGYNGSGYEAGNYHAKIAAEMERLS
jgi:hypothetical protein